MVQKVSLIGMNDLIFKKLVNKQKNEKKLSFFHKNIF